MRQSRHRALQADLLRWGVVVRVQCYSGYRAEETPRRLLLDGRSVDLVEVLARWRTAETRGFRVRGDDGAIYVVVQAETSGLWTAEATAENALGVRGLGRS